MGSQKVICITGIDTDIGKSIVTGLLANYISNLGKTVITQKICQTGSREVSEDILTHRAIMGIDLLEIDRQGVTCPYIFPEPCSPHLAARLAGEEIDCAKIFAATTQLSHIFEYVIVEGVGGLQVPLTLDYTLLDYLTDKKYPIILVSSSRLGSINHTLSSLELIKNRGCEILGIVYNRFGDTHEKIAGDSREVFAYYLKKNGFIENIIDMPFVDLNKKGGVLDFSQFFPQEI